MFDVLDDVLAGSLALLTQAADDPGHAWRNVTLATLGRDGTPQARTVVLRRLDPVARILEIHTDRRSAKHAELLAHPACQVQGWDAGRKIQLRLTCIAAVHTGEAADAAWPALGARSRATYRITPGPGTRMATPEDAGVTDEAAGRAVFCLIRLHFDRLEWLHLGQGSHRRARFTWANGRCTAMWLVP